MGESAGIKLSDIRAMTRLLGECRELGDDPIVWRQHLCGGIAQMVGAELITSGEMTGCLGGNVRMPGGTAWGFENGFNAAGYRILMEHGPVRAATFRAGIGELRARGAMTMARQQLVTDRMWYRSFEYDVIARTIGTDAMIQSMIPIDAARDEVDGMGLCRSTGRPAFSEREVDLVNLVHLEVARQVGGPLSRFGEPAPSQLPPRVRQVLRCLLEGDGDKQIAVRLALSQYTVNQYTKQIYLFFGVSGRTELLARWVRRAWGSKANWDAASDAPRFADVDR
jgi:DNA-binding NarL/FixJ family response regulator